MIFHHRKSLDPTIRPHTLHTRWRNLASAFCGRWLEILYMPKLWLELSAFLNGERQ